MLFASDLCYDQEESHEEESAYSCLIPSTEGESLIPSTEGDPLVSSTEGDPLVPFTERERRDPTPLLSSDRTLFNEWAGRGSFTERNHHPPLAPFNEWAGRSSNCHPPLALFNGQSRNCHPPLAPFIDRKGRASSEAHSSSDACLDQALEHEDTYLQVAQVVSCLSGYCDHFLALSTTSRDVVDGGPCWHVAPSAFPGCFVCARIRYGDAVDG